MKSRDRVIALVLVAAIVVGIWWLGKRLRGPGAGDDAGEAATVEIPSATASASVPAADASAEAGSSPEAVADASAESAACRAIDDASKKVLDEARKSRPCTPDPDMSSLGCRSTSKGTWGFRVDDVFEGAPSAQGDKCGDTGFLVRLVHVDPSGAEESIVPGLTLDVYGPSGPHAATITTGYRAARMSAASFFDYDGDGDDEVFVRTTVGTYDRVERQDGTVFTFREVAGDGGASAPPDAGKPHIVPYAPAASLVIDTARDVDGDGRPDFLVAIGGGFGGAAAPVGIRLLAHSLPDGTFSMRDAPAVAWAQKQCPADPKLDLATKTADDFGQKLADDMACALLWGRDKDLGAGVAKACPRTAEVPPPDSGVCPSWAKSLVGVRPAILLR